MATIEINERTKAGKLILETARLLSKENEGIEITTDADDRALATQMQKNRKGDLLSMNEKASFIEELKKTAAK